MLQLMLRLTVIVVGLGCFDAPAQAQAPVAKAPHAAGRASGRKLEDPARWNDRTTPRKTLETFYFAISGYDRSPGLIANAIDCLDLTALDLADLASEMRHYWPISSSSSSIARPFPSRMPRSPRR